jgi:hypothetical protein
MVIHGQAGVLPPPVSFPVSECLYSPRKAAIEKAQYQ